MPRCGNRKTQSPGSVGAGGRAGRSVGRSWCPPRSGGNPLTRTGLKQGRRFLLDPVRCFPSGTPGSSHFRPHHVRCSYPTARRASPRRAVQSGLPTGLAPLQSAVREWQFPAAHRHTPPTPHPHPRHGSIHFPPLLRTGAFRTNHQCESRESALWPMSLPPSERPLQGLSVWGLLLWSPKFFLVRSKGLL